MSHGSTPVGRPPPGARDQEQSPLGQFGPGWLARYAAFLGDAVLVHDDLGVIIDANTAAGRLFGYDESELIGMPISRIEPDYERHDILRRLSTLVVGDAIRTMGRPLHRDGDPVDVEVTVTAVSDGHRRHYVAVLRDVRRRVAAEAALKRALNEKSAMLAELHHRVKNNLAVVASLVRMTQVRFEHEAGREALGALRSRVIMMARLHESLYSQADASAISLHTYLEDIVRETIRTWRGPDRPLRLALALAPAVVPVSHALPIAMVTSELVSNALRHGLSGLEGLLSVELSRDQDTVVVTVTDDGVGAQASGHAGGLAGLDNPGVGTRIVQSLARQLGGSVTWRGRDPGVEARLVARLPDDSIAKALPLSQPARTRHEH